MLYPRLLTIYTHLAAQNYMLYKNFMVRLFRSSQSARSCQKATALAAATLRESTPPDIGIRAV